MNAIEVKKLNFAYPKREQILTNVGISFKAEEFTAITGLNGVGKTTLGKLLTGILKPISGTVMIYGKDSAKIKLSEIGTKICYSFQNPDYQLFTESVQDEIGFALKYKDMETKSIKPIVDEMMDIFQISHLKNSFPMQLSYGEKKRVVLAAGLALNPSFLILDEPTPGLDVEMVKILSSIFANLKKKKIGAILISHDKPFIGDNAERVYLMEKGGILIEQFN